MNATEGEEGQEVERFSISLKNITPPCKNFKFRDQRYKVDFEIKNHHRTIEMLFVSEAKYDKNSVYKSYGETKVNHNRFFELHRNNRSII